MLSYRQLAANNGLLEIWSKFHLTEILYETDNTVNELDFR